MCHYHGSLLPPAQNTDCINQATFLIQVYVLTIYPLLLVLSLLENLRETEIGAVMLEFFIPKIHFSTVFTKMFFFTLQDTSEKKCYQADIDSDRLQEKAYLSQKKWLDYYPQQIILCAMCRLL